MQWTLDTVRRALGDKLIGKIYMREAVCKTLLLLPDKIIKEVCKSVWFVSSPDDAWAITFKGGQIKDHHIVFLSEELFMQNEEKITYSILHEVGHVILNHDNSIGYFQTDSEINRQEQEADRFAKKYGIS